VKGKVHFVRYADDFVICTNKEDAPVILKELGMRLDRFSLKLNTEKTKVIDFSRKDEIKGSKQGTFKFLGFTFYLGKSRKGWMLVKVKTDREIFARKLKEITVWCKTKRNKYRLAYLWNIFCSKVRGHIQYYGISHNLVRVKEFRYHARRAFFKWMNRRSQKKSFSWAKFELYEKLNPIPQAKVGYRLF